MNEKLKRRLKGEGEHGTQRPRTRFRGKSYGGRTLQREAGDEAGSGMDQVQFTET